MSALSRPVPPNFSTDLELKDGSGGDTVDNAFPNYIEEVNGQFACMKTTRRPNVEAKTLVVRNRPVLAYAAGFPHS